MNTGAFNITVTDMGQIANAGGKNTLEETNVGFSFDVDHAGDGRLRQRRNYA